MKPSTKLREIPSPTQPGSDAHALQISLLGAKAILFEAPGAMDLPQQRRIWDLAQRLAAWPEVAEVVPGMANLMLVLRQPPADIASVEGALRQAWEESVELHIEGRHLALDVIYGGEGGPHLADVVAHTGLSVDDIVQMHAAPLYAVLGFLSTNGELVLRTEYNNRIT